MAQNFRRYTSTGIGTSNTTVYTATDYATVIGITVANTTTVSVNVTVSIYNGTTGVNIVKTAPVPVGSTLQVIDGGAKIVLQSGDAVKVLSDTASSIDVWLSSVDSISS